MQHDNKLNKIHSGYSLTSKFCYQLPTTLPLCSPYFWEEQLGTFGVVHSEGTQKNNRKKPHTLIKQEEEAVEGGKGTVCV